MPQRPVVVFDGQQSFAVDGPDGANAIEVND